MNNFEHTESEISKYNPKLVNDAWAANTCVSTKEAGKALGL